MSIENAWDDNEWTVSGRIMHERAHDPFFTEKRGDLIITREMPMLSRRLKIQGKCDIVEFRRDNISGISLFGRKGKWLPCPVEYKRGSPKITDADRLQLCAQAICLEEMLLCPPIEEAYIYYGEIKNRETVSLTVELRDKVEALFAEMHSAYVQRKTPRVKTTKACNACSLKDACLPKLLQPKKSVSAYLDEQLKDI